MENEFTFENPEYRKTYWHTCSHIMAQAVKRLWPEVQLAIGPAIDEGWYYDFDAPFTFTPEHLAKIEAEMKKVCKERLPIVRSEKPRAEAIAYMQERNEPYKVELINDLPEDAVISFYTQGDFTDLCAGPPSGSHRPRQAQRLQAAQFLRRLLAGRQQPEDAPENLRHCLPEQGRAGDLPSAHRRGQEA